MVRGIYMRFVQITDFLKTNDLASFFKSVIYIKRKAIVIEKNLYEVNNKWLNYQDSNIRFEEINSNAFFDNQYRFSIKNRYYKALYYLEKGYSGHAVVKGEEVVGDIWYSATKENGKLSVHPDVNKFRINTSNDHAYSFDQFVVPTERGKKIAAALVNFQLCSLQEKKYKKVFGFYWSDNIPAIWNNRIMNKYKEINALRVYGCWLYSISSKKDN